MKQWGLSHYTSVIKCDSGEVLLYNSFMGAIARLSVQQYRDIEKFITHGFKEPDITNNNVLQELCTGGFFVPSDLDEQKKVTELLDKEREAVRFSMIILPHENCNFRCVYCYEKFERGKMESDIIKGLKLFVDRKVQETQGLKELNVSWFGGEPLLAQDIIYELSASFISSCKDNAISYASGGMSTNGYFLTPSVVDSLLECKIKRFQITLDGPESIHNTNRKLIGGGKTYKRILDNLTKMHDRNDDFFIRIRVNFNNDSVSSIKRWLDKEITPLFSNDPRFALSFNSIGKWGGPNDATLDICDSVSASTLRAQFATISQVCNFSDKIVKEPLMPHGNVCYASRGSSIVVGSNGTIYKCTVAFDDPRNIVGKLTTGGQLQINQTLWDQWTKLNDKDTTWCELCSFYPACQGRKCPLVAINQKRPVCPMTKEEYETLVQLVAGCKT